MRENENHTFFQLKYFQCFKNSCLDFRIYNHKKNRTVVNMEQKYGCRNVLFTRNTGDVSVVIANKSVKHKATPMKNGTTMPNREQFFLYMKS